MLDYLFFVEPPFRKFLAFLEEKGVPVEQEVGEEQFEVRIPEELDDDLIDAIEVRYEELMDEGMAMMEEEDHHAAGVVVNLKDGETAYAIVRPELLNRVLGVISPEELGELVNAVVDAVENPDQRTFCQRLRDGD
ncbi:hypothetical protein [Endothiovibrio diazotrophicus]